MPNRILYTSKSPFHSYLEVAEEDGKLVLNTENGNYSFGNLHKVFEEVFRLEKFNQLTFNNILILGLGGGSIVQLLRDDYQIQSPITAVEIDAEIVRIAMEWFGLERYRNVLIEIEDATDYIQSTSHKFDLILTDIYIDLEIPDHCQSEEFLKTLTQLLSESGKLIYNKVVTNTKQRKEFTRIIGALNKLGQTRHYTILDANKVIIFEHDKETSRSQMYQPAGAINDIVYNFERE